MKTQPSSLPLSERLRFFSNLSGSSKRNSCSFTRSPPFNSIERCSSTSSYHYYMATTPRSSTSLSSASVTPTPTECALPLFAESPVTLRKESFASALANEPSSDAMEPGNDLTDSRLAIKSDIVKTSPFLQASRQSLTIPAHVAETEIKPTAALTPTMKRIKLKTIGKLTLPSSFLNNDRNNNSPKDLSIPNKATASPSDSSGETENSGPPKKIGKIKSRFIESCNQNQAKQIQTNETKGLKFDYKNKTQNSPTALTSLENSTEHLATDMSASPNGLSNGPTPNQRKYQNTSLQMNGNHHYYLYHPYAQPQHIEDFSTDSGKENVDTPPKEQTTPVIEIRRKFTRKANTSQSFNSSTASGITRQLTPRSVSLNGPHSSPQVDDKYAKYFGVTPFVKSTKINQPLGTVKKSTSHDCFGQQQLEKPKQTQAIAINRNVHLWHSSARGINHMMGSVINEVKSFEDISFTEEELMSASKQFDSLLLNDSILLHSPKEFENIFSSIV